MKSLLIRIGILTSLAIFFVFNLNSEVSRTNIAYEISLNKNQYLEGEDILLEMKFKNTGKVIDSLINFNESNLIKNLIIKEQNTKKENYMGPVGGNEKTIKLTPGEEIVNSSEIRFYRGTNTIEMFNYFPKGSYTIQGKLSRGKKFIESNILSFEIIPPKGNEKKVLDQFITISKNSTKENMEVTIDQLVFLLKDNAQSIYSDEIFINLILKRRISRIKYDSTFINDCLWFIENKSNSKHLDLALNESAELIYYKFGGKEKVDTFLDDLRNKYYNTRISEIAEKLKVDPKFK